MDYLVIEGYKSAAEEFSKEADLAAPVDFQSIEDRTNIREALQRGDIDEAIVRVNDLNPEVSRYSWFPSKGLYPFMHHAQTLVSMRIIKHQNFSLQYDHLFLYLEILTLLRTDLYSSRFSTQILHYTFVCNSRS